MDRSTFETFDDLITNQEKVLGLVKWLTDKVKKLEKKIAQQDYEIFMLNDKLGLVEHDE